MGNSGRSRAGVLLRGVLMLAGVSGAVVFAAVPPVPTPPENPYNAATPTADQAAKRALGKILFWEEQISADNTVSCGTCHSLNRGGTDERRTRHPGVDGFYFTSDDTFGSPGVVRQADTGEYKPDSVFELTTQVTRRTAPPVINAAYGTQLFHDGRAGFPTPGHPVGEFIDPQNPSIVRIATGGALEIQAVGPPMNDGEMGHEQRQWSEVAAKLQTATPLIFASNLPADVAAVLSNPATDTYPELFAAAFPTGVYPDNPNPGEITAWKIAFAIATYERTLISDDSPWDRRMADPVNFPLPPQQEEGWQFFNALCVSCHTADNVPVNDPGSTHGLFTDHDFHNIGLRPSYQDYGRAEVTSPTDMANSPDRGKFKSVTLRNIGLKTNYMHHGVFSNLLNTIEFYRDGTPGCSECIADRDIRIAEAQDFLQNLFPPETTARMETFLKHALTDPRVEFAQFPFDFPTLWTLRPADRPQTYVGGVSGSGGYTPVIVINTPPMLGNADFKIGLFRGLAGAEARLGISSTPPVNGRITPSAYLTSAVLSGTTGSGTGYTTYYMPIPPNGALAGQTRYFQWFVNDSQAPAGEALSPPASVQFFCPRTGCPPTCSADIDNGLAVGIPDGGVDINDLLFFLSSFESGDNAADLDDDGADPALPDGGVDINDLLFFLSHFELGC